MTNVFNPLMCEDACVYTFVKEKKYHIFALWHITQKRVIGVVFEMK